MSAARYVIPLCLGVTVVLGASAARAEAPMVMAEACNGCHGTDGQSRGAMPSFIGKDAAAIKKFLLEYKSGAREATVMDRIAKGYSDEQLDAIASYFGSKRKN